MHFFPPFRLDSRNEQLWRGNDEVRLRRKTFAVLRYLVERPGQLVTKAVLLDGVWPDVSVSDSMPAISVRELRKALGDSVATPRFIETVQARGYRFIARVTLEPGDGAAPNAAAQPSSQLHVARDGFVGRERERSELRAAIADAVSGHGRLCLISGEPGIGKSRLCAELAAEAAAKGMTVMVGHCYEQEAIPYLPFVEILEAFVDATSSRVELHRAMGEEGPELARLLPKLKRILPDLPNRSAQAELSPEQGRRQLFNSFCNFIARQSRSRPLLLILEDLHWADDSTLALFSHLAQRHSELPLMVVGTHRVSGAEVRPNLSLTLEDLVRGRLTTQVRLEGLVRDEVALMLKGLGGQQAPAAVVREIHAETGGNPFFVEELFRHLSEENQLFDPAGKYRADLKIEEREVPQNVRLVVGRRFARLTEATARTLGVAAVIGRSFTFELLEASTLTKGEALLDCLDEAERVGLIRSSTEYPEAQFEFFHELTRQVVLSHLSPGRRQRLHLEVAEAIERIYSDTLEDRYGELAYHYPLTTNARKAIDYLKLAGQQAGSRSAHVLAVRLLNSGLDLLMKLPETAERDRHELALQHVLGASLMETKGDASPEVGAVYARTVELCDRVGDATDLVVLRLGQSLYYMNRGQHRTCDEINRTMLSAAINSEDPVHLLWGHGFVGMSSFWMGELELAHSHFDKSYSYYDPPKHRGLSDFVGMHPAPGLGGYSAWPAWMLGYPDQSLHRIRRTLTDAKEIAHTSSTAMAFSHAAAGYLLLRDADEARRLAEAGLALSNEHGFGLWAAICTLGLAGALTQSGQAAEGLAAYKEGLRLYRARGSEGSLPYLLAGMAEAHGMLGQVGEGLKLIEEAITRAHDTAELSHEPELHRMKGELLLMKDASNPAAAERSFRTAIEHSRQHSAKSWELRATISLARLLIKQRKRDEARTILAEIYGWFTEGFDTADLKDAKALLEALGR
jgi:adenylate cyclase